jgi:hypothetical protein
MANLKKFKDPVRLYLMTEKMTKDQLEIRAISKGLSVTELVNEYIKKGLHAEKARQ